MVGVRSATSTVNDDRQTRLDADQLRTHFELKTGVARKGLGGGGFGLSRDTCTALFRFTGRP